MHAFREKHRSTTHTYSKTQTESHRQVTAPVAEMLQRVIVHCSQSFLCVLNSNRVTSMTGFHQEASRIKQTYRLITICLHAPNVFRLTLTIFWKQQRKYTINVHHTKLTNLGSFLFLAFFLSCFLSIYLCFILSFEASFFHSCFYALSLYTFSITFSEAVVEQNERTRE